MLTLTSQQTADIEASRPSSEVISIEANASFYLDPVNLPIVEALKTKGEIDITRYPAPHLVIEVDMRWPDFELRGDWGCRGLGVGRLGEDGSYMALPRSGWFPISADEISSAIAIAPGGTLARRHIMRVFVSRSCRGRM